MTGLAPVRLVPSSFCLAISRTKSTQSVIDVAKVVCYIDYIRIILSMYQTTDWYNATPTQNHHYFQGGFEK